MELLMNGEFLQMIADTRGELDNIRKWINAGNQFDSKTRYLIPTLLSKLVVRLKSFLRI